MAQKPVAMISSTTRDLPEHRKAAHDACLRQDFFPKMMEHLPPTPHDAVRLSLQMVDEAEVYILVLGVRYGEVPEGYDRSYTHLELDRAIERGIPILAMVMDLQRHPIMPADMETGPGAQRLDELREQVRRRQGVGYFDSPDEMRALLIDGLSDLKAQLGSEPAGIHFVRRLPTAPEPYIAHPYTLLQTQDLVGRQADLNALTDWVTGARPIFVMTAIGGMGKSALTWKWYNDIAPQEMRPLAGRVWWSFYESDARHANFVTRTLAYVTGQSLESVEALTLADREDALLIVLDTKPYLIVLDGLERQLIAYARRDAAHLADDALDEQTAHAVAGWQGLPASAATSYTGQARLRQAVDQRVSAFLRRLTAVRASRILVSTRLFPVDLQTITTAPVVGVEAYFLRGLANDDAVALWRAFGVSGGRDELVELFGSFENYPLLIRALAGEVARFRGSPGNFDAWRAANPSFDPFALDLRQRNSHVLAYALHGVSQEQARTLHVVAAFQMPATYQALHALLIGDERAFASEPELDRALEELEDRGLLGWDKVANRYDLHPIVRGVAWSTVDADGRRDIYSDLAGHFGSLPKVEDDDIHSVDDLAGVIEHFYTLLMLGHAQEAWDLFSSGLHEQLFELAALGDLVDMFQAAIETERGFAAVHDDDLAGAVGLNGLMQEMCGNPAKVLTFCDRAEASPVTIRGMRCYVAIARARALLASGRIIAATEAVRAAIAHLDDVADADREGTGGLCLSILSVIEATRGNLAEARRWMVDVRLADIGTVVLSEGLTWQIQLEIREGNLDMMAALYRFLEPAGGDGAKPMAHILIGRMWASLVNACGRPDEAGAILREALAWARTGDVVRVEVELLIELGVWNLDRGGTLEARRCFRQADSLIADGDLRLLRADALNLLSRIERADGNIDAAIAAAQDAYCAAWCDGPPFAYADALDTARSTLRELGATVPDDLSSAAVPALPALSLEPIDLIEALALPRDRHPSLWQELRISTGFALCRRGHLSTFLDDISDLTLHGTERGTLITALADVAGPDAFDWALAHQHAVIRRAAVAVAPIEQPTTRLRLHALATDESAFVRMAAIERLLSEDGANVHDLRLWALAENPDPLVRLRAADIAADPEPWTRVGGLSVDQWTSLLQLATNSDAVVRREALLQLTRDYGNPEVAAEQISAFRTALEQHVRCPDPFGSEAIATKAAMLWWAIVSGEDRFALVVAALESSIGGVVRWGVGRAAEAIAAPASADNSDRMALKALILDNLASPDVSRRRPTARALALVARQHDWVDWNALLEDDDEPVRQAAIYALAPRNDGRLPPLLWPEP